MHQNGSRRITQNHDVLLSRTGGEAVLVDTTSGSVHVLNATAARIWELCSGEPTADELLEALSREYGISNEQLQPDVEELLETLHALQLIAFSASS